MGLTPLWRLRAAEAAPPDLPAPAAEESAAREETARERPALREIPARPIVAPEPARVFTSDEPSAERIARIKALDWPALEESIRACRACALCQQREQAVPGVGDRGARWMLVGEGPGAEEDRRGEPFVGQAGKLLDNMLAAIGLARGQDVYIANAVKCRPPRNRTPEAAEIAACLSFLDRQIALVQPCLLIALGRPAAQALLGREIAISAARGKRFERDGITTLVTYHPAYLLRNPFDKSKAWEDLCFARALMEKETAAR
ncbi:MAG: uracil-DNA glycosylase [Azoarcus sp.]|jgi:DNA polymerase|nr:uracil-DNA glycosylase [Azoarcus sp.]